MRRTASCRRPLGCSGRHTKVNRCLAEGRKSFLARYAGIEEGEECRRWAPVLSAMVDGEATPEQLVALRPHLRNCAACKAAVRELRASNASLAALFPVGVLAADGDGRGLVEAAGDLLSRLWEAACGDLGDRAASLGFRAQALAQAVAPGRGVAVAASVAALAGGGVAIESAERTPAPPRVAVGPAPSPSPVADRVTFARVAPAVSAPAAAATRTTAARPARQKSRTRRTPKHHVRARHTHAAVARAPQRATTVAAPLRPAPAPVSTAPPAPRPATSSVPPPAVAAPTVVRPAAAAPSRGPGAADGGAEFGVESG